MHPSENSRTAMGVVIACTVGNLLCMTTTVSAVFGVFLVEIAGDFNWPRAQVSGVLGLIAFINFIGYPIVGRAIDRFGARRILLCGNVLLAASVGAVGLSTNNVASFYGHFVLIGIAGAIPCTAMFSKVVAEWYDRRRGLMLGISAGLGNGLGATIMPIIAAAALVSVGWKNSFALIGLLIFAIGFPIQFFLLRERPRAESLHVNSAGDTVVEGATLRQAVSSAPFWLIIATLGVGAGCLTAIFSHVIPILTDRSLDLSIAASVMSTLALVTTGAQVLSGSLLDRFASPRVIAPAFLTSAIGLWLLEHGTGGTLLIAGAMLGIGLGAAFGGLPLFISRYFGLRSFGIISGVIYSIVMLAQGATPVIMDWSFDRQGSYAFSIAILEAALVLVAMLIALLPPFGKHAAKQDAQHGTLAHVGL